MVNAYTKWGIADYDCYYGAVLTETVLSIQTPIMRIILNEIPVIQYKIWMNYQNQCFQH